MPSVILSLGNVLFKIFHDFKGTIVIWLCNLYGATLLGIFLDTECTYLDPIGDRNDAQL